MCSRSLDGSPGIRSRRSVRQSGGGASQPGFSAGSGRGCVFGVAGFFTSSNGSDACGSCDEIEDQYQDSAGSSRCLHCPPNSRRDVREDAFKSIKGCVCNDGFFAPRAAEGFACIPCPPGGQCDGKLHLPYAQSATTGAAAPIGSLHSVAEAAILLGMRSQGSGLPSSRATQGSRPSLGLKMTRLCTRARLFDASMRPRAGPLRSAAIQMAV